MKLSQAIIELPKLDLSVDMTIKEYQSISRLIKLLKSNEFIFKTTRSERLKKVYELTSEYQKV